MALFLNPCITNRRRKLYNERRIISEQNYKELFRFNSHQVQWLANEFLVETHETRGGRLSNHQRMQIFLRYMADPGYQAGVGQDIGIHQTTASQLIWEVAQNIYSKSEDWIRFPATPLQFESAINAYQQKQRFPNAIGALDCTHIPINKPTVHGDEYVNRKGYTSFNVQAVCDAQECFMNVECVWPGSVHDSRIWTNSDAYALLMENTRGAVVLGDEGYGVSPWVMTPFRNPTTLQQVNYNYTHRKERLTIERVFGQLKSRFPILKGPIRLSTARVPIVVIACCILHNVAKFLSNGPNDGIEMDPTILVQPSQSNGNLTVRGKTYRNVIVEYLSENQPL